MSPRERLFALELFGIKLGLDNIRALLAALKNPQHDFPTIHVAGTNGKGSVTAMVELGLRAAGHRTGRYTSPHLAQIEERVAIGGVDIDAARFDEVTADVLAAADRLQQAKTLPHPPTFFEATTAIAFEVFRRERVTAAVVEVGLGGRFDATNVITPTVSAITSIAFDHERHLGDSLDRIAFEKAGIIKNGVPVVVGRMEEHPRRVIEDTARALAAPVVIAEPSDEPRGTALTLALQGRHQRDNAAVAAAILALCGERGLGVTREHIVRALTEAEWSARLEWLQLPDGQHVLIDAAHNPAGALALAEYVRDLGDPLPLVLGVMRDKDVDAIVHAIAPAAACVVATRADSPRALDARALAERLRQLLPAVDVDHRDDPEAALALALTRAPRAVAAGSIFLVGPLRDRLLGRGATPVRYPSKATPFFLS